MRRTAVIVALLLVLSGCNALPTGGSSEPADTPTLTPVDVPPGESLRTPTPAQTACLAPRVAPPERTPEPTPVTPQPLPVQNGTIRGTALTAVHRQTLANYSFTLRIGATRIQSMPRASAFTYEGVSLGFGSVRVFAVAGTIYRLQESDSGVTVDTQSYRPAAGERGWYLDALTGRDWLAGRIAPFNFTQVGTRTWNGTEVRVFRDDFDGEVLIGAGSAMRINSTVLVDRRGIVRHVRHVRTVRSDDGDKIVETTEVETLTVTDVDSTVVTRPEDFCVPASEVGNLSTAKPETGDPGRATGTEQPTASPSSGTAGGDLTETAGESVTGTTSADTATGRTLTFAPYPSAPDAETSTPTPTD